MYNGDIPFGPDGNHMDSRFGAKATWVPNFEFEAIMTFQYVTRGRSSVQFVFLDAEGKRYYMFAKDMSNLILATTLVNGVVSGRWTFCKRGSNYGVQFVESLGL